VVKKKWEKTFQRIFGPQTKGCQVSAGKNEDTTIKSWGQLCGAGEGRVLWGGGGNGTNPKRPHKSEGGVKKTKLHSPGKVSKPYINSCNTSKRVVVLKRGRDGRPRNIQRGGKSMGKCSLGGGWSCLFILQQPESPKARGIVKGEGVSGHLGGKYY